MPGEQPLVHTEALSYFSRPTAGRNAAAWLKYGGSGRRCDRWFRMVSIVYYLSSPDAVRILNFPHGIEHIALIGQASFGENKAKANDWLSFNAANSKRMAPLLF